MTRFARAKGSKASNEKLANEPTPWHVMKQHLQESLNKEKPVKERTKTARQLLEEKEISTPSKNDWAEFEKPKVTKKAEKFKASSKIEKPSEKGVKKKKLKKFLQRQKENSLDLVEDVSEKIKVKIQVLDKPEKVEKVKRKVKRPKSQIEPSEESTSAPKKKKFNKTEARNETAGDKVPKKKKKNVIPEKSAENSLSVSEESKTNPTERLSKRQKRNLKKKNQNLEAQMKKPSNSVFDTEENDWNTDVKFGNNTEKKSGPVKKGANCLERSFKNMNQVKFGRPNMKNHHLRKPKARDDKEHQRRKPAKSTKLIINGMEIEVVMYDGFPVQKDDAVRLKELKQQMILKGSSLFIFNYNQSSGFIIIILIILSEGLNTRF